LDVDDVGEADAVMCPKRIGIITDVPEELRDVWSSKMDLSVFPVLEMAVKAISPSVRMSMRCTVS